MDEENRPLDEGTPEIESDPAPQPSQRPEYTKSQRLMALILAIVVIIITLMYVHAIATGDLFTR